MPTLTHIQKIPFTVEVASQGDGVWEVDGEVEIVIADENVARLSRNGGELAFEGLTEGTTTARISGDAISGTDRLELFTVVEITVVRDDTLGLRVTFGEPRRR